MEFGLGRGREAGRQALPECVLCWFFSYFFGLSYLLSLLHILFFLLIHVCIFLDGGILILLIFRYQIIHI